MDCRKPTNENTFYLTKQKVHHTASEYENHGSEVRNPKVRVSLLVGTQNQWLMLTIYSADKATRAYLLQKEKLLSLSRTL